MVAKKAFNKSLSEYSVDVSIKEWKKRSWWSLVAIFEQESPLRALKIHFSKCARFNERLLVIY